MRLCLADNKLIYNRSKPLVTGFDMASASLMNAICRYSDAESIVLLSDGEPSYLNSVHDLAQTIKRRRADQSLEVCSSLSVLFHGPEMLGDIDLIHSVKENAVPLLSLRETLHKPVPLTFTIHCLSEQHMINDLFFPLSVLPFKPYDAIICTSETVRSTIGKMLDRIDSCRNYNAPASSIQLRKIPLGIDTDQFQPMDKQALRKKYGLNPDAFVLLWFGRFSDLFKADLHPLLTVFRCLKERNPDICLKLLLAGSEGRDDSESRALMEDARRLKIDPDIQIINNRDIRHRNELYNISDVFVSPTDNIQETFGLTPIEAMACGIPQVVSDWDGYKDTVIDKETGFLITTSWFDCLSDVRSNSYLPFDANQRRQIQRYMAVRSTVVDCEMMAERIQMLIDSPDLYRKMSEASRKRAVKEYHMPNIIAQKDHLWAELCEMAAETDGDDKIQSSFSKLIQTDYCRDFESYPTRFLNDQTEFIVNQKMIQIMNSSGIQSPLPVHRYPELLSTLEEEKTIEEIYEYICKKETVTIKEVSMAFAEQTCDQVRRTVMYLYKNNFLIVR